MLSNMGLCALYALHAFSTLSIYCSKYSCASENYHSFTALTDIFFTKLLYHVRF